MTSKDGRRQSGQNGQSAESGQSGQSGQSGRSQVSGSGFQGLRSEPKAQSPKPKASVPSKPLSFVEPLPAVAFRPERVLIPSALFTERVAKTTTMEDLVDAVIDAAEQASASQPKDRHPMRNQTHSPDSMKRVADLVHEAAKAVTDEHGVGLVVIVVDAAEAVQYKTDLGPTMTVGAFARCACLYDCKPRPPALDPGVPRGGVVSGGSIAAGPGGGVAGGHTTATGGNGSGQGIALGAAWYGVVSDPPGAGGVGRTGYSVVSDPPGAGGVGRTGGSHPTEHAASRKPGP